MFYLGSLCSSIELSQRNSFVARALKCAWQIFCVPPKKMANRQKQHMLDIVSRKHETDSKNECFLHPPERKKAKKKCSGKSCKKMTMFLAGDTPKVIVKKTEKRHNRPVKKKPAKQKLVP